MYVPHRIGLILAPTHDEIIKKYQSFAERIYSHGVENAYDVKRLIPGNELARQLGGLPTKQISEAQEKAVIYQVVNNITSKEAMEKEIETGRFKFP
jgi:hypothetical protein